MLLSLATFLLASTAAATPQVNKRTWNDWTLSHSDPQSSTTRSSSLSTSTVSSSTSIPASQTHWEDWWSSTSSKSSASFAAGSSTALTYKPSQSSPATTNLKDYPVTSGYVLVKGDAACGAGSSSSSRNSDAGNYNTGSNTSSGNGQGSGSGWTSSSSPLDQDFYNAPVSHLLKPSVVSSPEIPYRDDLSLP